ncbi:MAG: hypothetical protein ACKN9V_02180 [Pseudomonadota bacterium]
MLGAPPKEKSIWWLAIIEKKRVHIFSYSLTTKGLDSIFLLEESDHHDTISNLIRDSAGRTQASFSRTQGGHQTSHPKHSYSSLFSPDEKATLHLFKKAASFLKGEGKKGAYQALAVIGHAQSLGRFKELLDKKTKEKITLQSTHFSNYISPKKQAKRLLSVVPKKSPEPLRWLPNQNIRKG